MNEVMLNYIEEFHNYRNYNEFYDRYRVLIRSYISLQKPTDSNDIYYICRIVYLMIMEEIYYYNLFV